MDAVQRERLAVKLPWILGVPAFGLLVLLVRTIGWPVHDGDILGLRWATGMLTTCYAAGLMIWYVLGKDHYAWRTLLPRAIFTGLLLCEVVVASVWSDSLGDLFLLRNTLILVLVVSQFPILAGAWLRLARLGQWKLLPKFAPGMVFLLSFVVLIVIGAMLLMLPSATKNGISVVDAVFTSTSAACVTGLASVDPALEFTLTGQIILLLIIQAGGLGVMTLTYFFAMAVGNGITLRDRVMIRDMVNEDSLGQAGPMLRRIVWLTFGFEALGAVFLYISWQGQPACPPHLWWHAIFHSVSAFCNAGFSILPGGLTHPSTAYALSIQTIIMLLIVAGGLGFAIYDESWRQLVRRVHSARLPMRARPLPVRMTVHWRLAMAMTVALIVFGALVMFFCDTMQPPHSETTTAWRLWQALFNSVSCRTAGFNVTDMGAYAVPTALVMMALMFVGGNPGGTAGGIKTTTFAISLLEVIRVVRGWRDVTVAGRTIGREVIDRSFATIVISIGWVGTVTVVLALLQPQQKLVDLLFECVSAFGTVGLSRGITSILSEPAKLVLCLTMLAGRVGILTFALALAGAPRARDYEFPEARLPLN